MRQQQVAKRVFFFDDERLQCAAHKLAFQPTSVRAFLVVKTQAPLVGAQGLARTQGVLCTGIHFRSTGAKLAGMLNVSHHHTSCSRAGVSTVCAGGKDGDQRQHWSRVRPRSSGADAERNHSDGTCTEACHSPPPWFGNDTVLRMLAVTHTILRVDGCTYDVQGQILA